MGVTTSSPEIDLEMILANLPCYIYWTDRQGTIIGCNDLQAKSIGFSSRNELIGSHLTDINPQTYPNYTLTINQQIIETGKPHIAKKPIQQSDGSEAVRLLHKIPLKDKTDQIIGVLGVSFDVAEMQKQATPLIHKQIELAASTQNMISTSPGYLYWKDCAGKYLGCNNQWAKDLGLSSTQDIIGKTDYDLFPENIAEKLSIADQQVITLKEPNMVEETVKFNNDRSVILLSTKKPLFDAKNKVIGVIGNSFDISERKKERTALQHAKTRAEKANQLKTQFIRDVEHDIRTPLSGVWSVLDVWYHDEVDPEKKQMMGEMCRALWQLMEYCNDILDFSRIEYNKVPIKRSAFPLKKLSNNIIEMERITAKKKGLDIELDYDANIPLVIHGDRYRLNRILINLMGNAIKFTKEGYVKLVVTPQPTTQQDGPLLIRFDIVDSGIGLAEGKLQLLRENFANFDPDSQGLYLGPGLGMRVVNQFIHELNGKIEIESEFGKGSTFSVILPFEQSASKEDE